MPKGLCLPLPDDAESTIGNNGQIQGANIVTKPARNENNINTIIRTSGLKRLRAPIGLI